VARDAPCFVGIADRASHLVFINDYGRRITGLPDSADLATLSVPDFFASDARDTLRNVVLPTLLQEGAWEGEYRFHHFGGREGAVVKWSAFLLREAGGEMIGAGWLTSDLTQRLEVEGRLRESRARLKAAGDLVGLSSYLWDPRTGALQWDERLRDLWGVPPGVEPDEALWMQGVHPEDRERVQAEADRAIDPDGDGVYAIEYRVVGLKGEPERWIRTYGETRFEGRAPVTFTGAVLEITDQKLAEAQLRRSEAYLAAILRQLPVGVSVFDTEGRQVLGNAAAERFHMRNMPSRDPESAKLWQGFRGDGGPLPTSDYPGARALRGETTALGAEFLYTLADGAQIWTRVSAAPLRGSDDAIQGVVWVIEDVDDQRRNEARRQESEERFRRFAENSRDVLWIFNPERTRLEYLSPGFQPTWGVPPEAAFADIEVWNGLVHPDDRLARAETFNRVVADGEPITHEYRIMRPDGSVRWIRDTTFPIRDADDRLSQIGGIAHDVSLRQALCVDVVAPDRHVREARARPAPRRTSGDHLRDRGRISRCRLRIGFRLCVRADRRRQPGALCAGGRPARAAHRPAADL
jgi:PAS domain S-box-containing protein